MSSGLAAICRWNCSIWSWKEPERGRGGEGKGGEGGSEGVRRGEGRGGEGGSEERRGEGRGGEGRE